MNFEGMLLVNPPLHPLPSPPAAERSIRLDNYHSLITFNLTWNGINEQSVFLFMTFAPSARSRPFNSIAEQLINILIAFDWPIDFLFPWKSTTFPSTVFAINESGGMLLIDENFHPKAPPKNASQSTPTSNRCYRMEIDFIQISRGGIPSKSSPDNAIEFVIRHLTHSLMMFDE